MANKLTKGDYISLSKAVAQFNQTINELKTVENKTYLPNEIVYKDVREKIVGKNELDRYIKNLRNFKKENADVYITESGEKLTKWERKVLEEERKIAINRMTKKLEKVNPYDKDTRISLTSNIENLKKLENLKKSDFKDLVARIHNIGVRDYDLRRAIQYRENYYHALEGISHYENYVKFKNRIDRIHDPIKFFKFIEKSDIMKDLFTYYKGGKGLVIRCFFN